MKKMSLITAFLSFCYVSTLCQPCFPEGIEFNTQAQIDSFQINYPGCTEIEGNVLIGDFPPSTINNLEGLQVLTSIAGDLIIGGNFYLSNLSGLDNLDSIGGSLKIGYLYEGGGLGNWNLTSLTGLENLTYIGGNLWIRWNFDLLNLTGLDNVICIGEDLIISPNEVLHSLTGLSSVTTTGGDLSISHNDSLTSLTGLENVTSIGGDLGIFGHALTSISSINNLTSIGGSLRIGSSSLTSMLGLGNLTIVHGALRISSNYNLMNLTGLDNITTVEGEVVIHHNNSLTSLTGLEGLHSIEEALRIHNNNALANLNGLNNLTTIEEGYWGMSQISISSNQTLISLAGLENIEPGTFNNLQITNNYSLSTCEVKIVCEYLANNGGFAGIYDNAEGCNSPEEVQDSCEAHAGYIDISIDEDIISIYPNPATQELNITAEGHTIEEVNIYTLTGQQVHQESPVNGTIDISTLQPGMYIVEVMIENTRIRQKLLVQR